MGGKAKLILHTPESCHSCPLCVIRADECICAVTGEDVGNYVCVRAEECPLAVEETL